MQLNKVLKSLLIALPVLAVTACSSSDDAANSGSQTNQSAVSTVDSNGLNAQGQLTEQELKEQALRENQLSTSHSTTQLSRATTKQC